MKILRSILPFAALICLTGTSQGNELPEVKALESTDRAPPPLKLTLTSDQALYDWPGKPTFTLTIKNISASDVRLPLTISTADNRTSDGIFGIVVQCTDPPKLHGHSKGRIGGYSYRTYVLAPSEEISASKFDEAEIIYQGVYSYIGILCVEDGDGASWHGVLTSEPLTIEVKGPHSESNNRLQAIGDKSPQPDP